MKLYATKSYVYGSLASLHVSLCMSECIQTPCIKSQTYKAIYLSSWFRIWNVFVTYCVCQDCICMETLHLSKVKSASVNAVQLLQCPQNIPTNYIRWFICKLPSLYSVSCSKDIRKLNSRGHIFQLPLTRAPFQCLQRFRINYLAFPLTCSQATLTWLLRYLIMPANRGLRCPTNSQGGRTVPTRQLCQPTAGAGGPGEHSQPGCLSRLHRPLLARQPNGWAARGAIVRLEGVPEEPARACAGHFCCMPNTAAAFITLWKATVPFHVEVGNAGIILLDFE